MNPTSSLPAVPCGVKACADAFLADCGLWRNPYFEALRDGRMSLETFRASQEQFYFAVAFFSRPMAGLIARLPDFASRIDILRNVVEEHGNFVRHDAHAMTFDTFLQTLGSDVDRVHALRPCAAVHTFNSVLLSACLLEEIEVGIGCLGTIEYAFADLSARLGSGVVARGWVAPEKLTHYALHAQLDGRHADEFFALLEPKWSDRGKRELIERGIALGAHIFDRLYRELLVP
jgi:pyrroloquinoline-quinone synthase